jgi:hypothetical protein
MRARTTYPVKILTSPYKLTAVLPYEDLFGRFQEQLLTVAIWYSFGWAVRFGERNWVTVPDRAEAVRTLRGVAITAASS